MKKKLASCVLRSVYIVVCEFFMVQNFLFFALFAAAQIIGETMPISSSGHVALVCHLLGTTLSPDLVAIDDFFHGFMLLILLIVFFNTWWPVTRVTIRALFRFFTKSPLTYLDTQALSHFWALAKLVIIVDAITALAHVFKKPVGITDPNLLVFGFCLTMGMLLAVRTRSISLRYTQGERTTRYLSFKNALMLGTGQACALLIPGVSRFATTFFVATLLGLPQPKALKLSFIIFIPLLAGSFFLKGIPCIITHSALFLTPQTICLYTALTAIATGTFWGTYQLAKRNSFWYFGIYMIIPITTTLIYIYMH